MRQCLQALLIRVTVKMNRKVILLRGHMMEVEDDAPWTAETQLGDEEQFIVQPYQDEPIADADGLLTIMKRGENKKIYWKCLGVGSKDV